jgi:hypothetical protein
MLEDSERWKMSETLNGKGIFGELERENYKRFYVCASDMLMIMSTLLESFENEASNVVLRNKWIFRIPFCIKITNTERKNYSQLGWKQKRHQIP